MLQTLMLSNFFSVNSPSPPKHLNVRLYKDALFKTLSGDGVAFLDAFLYTGAAAMSPVAMGMIFAEKLLVEYYLFRTD